MFLHSIKVLILFIFSFSTALNVFGQDLVDQAKFKLTLKKSGPTGAIGNLVPIKISNSELGTLSPISFMFVLGKYVYNGKQFLSLSSGLPLLSELNPETEVWTEVILKCPGMAALDGSETWKSSTGDTYVSKSFTEPEIHIRKYKVGGFSNSKIYKIVTTGLPNEGNRPIRLSMTPEPGFSQKDCAAMNTLFQSGWTAQAHFRKSDYIVRIDSLKY